MIRRPPRATRTHTLSLHDALPILRHVEGGPDVEVIVELPAPRAILVAADAMDGQVARLRLGQIGVLAHHARERIFERRVAARGASGGLALVVDPFAEAFRSEEHTSELQSLMRLSYAVFWLKKKNNQTEEMETITRTSKRIIKQQ